MSAHRESCFSSWCSVKNPLRAALQAGWGTPAPHTPAGAPQCGSHLRPPGRLGRNTVCLLPTAGGCAHALGAALPALEPVPLPERMLPPLPQAPGGGQPAWHLCPGLTGTVFREVWPWPWGCRPTSLPCAAPRSGEPGEGATGGEAERGPAGARPQRGRVADEVRCRGGGRAISVTSGDFDATDVFKIRCGCLGFQFYFMSCLFLVV